MKTEIQLNRDDIVTALQSAYATPNTGLKVILEKINQPVVVMSGLYSTIDVPGEADMFVAITMPLKTRVEILTGDKVFLTDEV